MALLSESGRLCGKWPSENEALQERHRNLIQSYVCLSSKGPAAKLLPHGGCIPAKQLPQEVSYYWEPLIGNSGYIGGTGIRGPQFVFPADGLKRTEQTGLAPSNRGRLQSTWGTVEA